MEGLNRVLITGGAGFIGSNFIPFFLEQNPSCRIVNLDKLTYAGNLSNLEEVENNERYIFVEGDIAHIALLRRLFEEHQFNAVIHFAAESHVDNSIDRPADFIHTNINGTFCLLEVAREFWKPGSGNSTEHRFHHISTDEVYGSLGPEGYFTEESPYAPNSPYSASKAASDFLVRSYHHSYGMNVVTSNCSNNYGPRQHDEKLIPTVIRKALEGDDIPIYGDGSNVRDWIYVLDHCRGINLVFHQGKVAETYLIGGGNEFNNLYIARKICELLDRIHPKAAGSYAQQITFVEDRPGHDFRYAIDASKIKDELKWKADESFDSGLEKTIRWYLNKYVKV